MLALALAALLCAEELTPPPPPPPPPLVPAYPGPAEEQAVQNLPPPLAPLPPPLPVEELTEEERAEGAYNWTRVAVTGAAAGVSGALIVGGAMLFAFNFKGGGGSPGILVATLSLPAALFIGTAVGLGAHRALGGQGGYGAHLAGGAMGGGVALLGTLVVVSAFSSNPSTALVAGTVTAAAVLFGTGTGLMSELSSWRTFRELHPVMSVAPIPGGAMAMAGISF